MYFTTITKKRIFSFLIIFALFFSGCARPIESKPVNKQVIEGDYRITFFSESEVYQRRGLKSAELKLTIEYLGKDPTKEVHGSHVLGGFHLCDEARTPLYDYEVLDESFPFTFSVEDTYEDIADYSAFFKKQKAGIYQIKGYVDFTENEYPYRKINVEVFLPVELL